MPSAQRPALQKYFEGPRPLGSMWTLQRRGLTLKCDLATHVLGWELRVMAGDGFARSQVCKTEESVFETSEAWQTEATVKGWS